MQGKEINLKRQERAKFKALSKENKTYVQVGNYININVEIQRH